MAVLYISHHLEDVLSLADRITVLRDGKLIKSFPADQATINGLIALMVGRDIASKEYTTAFKTDRKPALEVLGLSALGSYQDISFDLYEGELVGIAGLPDSHKDELVDGLFGLALYQAGPVV